MSGKYANELRYIKYYFKKSHREMHGINNTGKSGEFLKERK